MSKRDDIMQATLELVAERGFHNTPTSLIAEMANSAEGTIFRHFKTKDALLEAIFSEELGKVKKEVGQSLNKSGDIAANFIALGMSFINYFMRHPTTFLYIEQYMNSPVGRDHRKRWLYSDEDWEIETHPLIGFLDMGKKLQQIKPLPNAILLSMVYGPIAFLLKESLFGDSAIDEHYFHDVLVACWEGIRIRDAAPG